MSATDFATSSMWLNGIITGLILTSMIGPITLTILRFGVVVDYRAGLAAAAGTWVSDLFYIGVTYGMTAGVEHWLALPGVRSGMYIGGGLGLMVMGGILLRRSPDTTSLSAAGIHRHRLRAFFAGFLVNTLSPFSLVFWLGSAVFLRSVGDGVGAYYVGLMGAIMAGDTLKAWLAPRLALVLAARRFRVLEVVSGLVVAGVGGYVLVRGLVGV